MSFIQSPINVRLEFILINENFLYLEMKFSNFHDFKYSVMCNSIKYYINFTTMNIKYHHKIYSKALKSTTSIMTLLQRVEI